MCSRCSARMYSLRSPRPFTTTNCRYSKPGQEREEHDRRQLQEVDPLVVAEVEHGEQRDQRHDEREDAERRPARDPRQVSVHPAEPHHGHQEHGEREEQERGSRRAALRAERQASDDQDQAERDEQDEETLDAGPPRSFSVAGGLRRRAHLSSLDSKTTRWASFHPRFTVLSSSGSSSPRKNIRMPSAQSRVRS